MPPKWMAFAYYRAITNRALFVIPPLNLLITVLWWMQDQWAIKAQATSWIEEETRRRMEQRLRDEWHLRAKRADDRTGPPR